MLQSFKKSLVRKIWLLVESLLPADAEFLLSIKPIEVRMLQKLRSRWSSFIPDHQFQYLQFLFAPIIEVLLKFPRIFFIEHDFAIIGELDDSWPIISVWTSQ